LDKLSDDGLDGEDFYNLHLWLSNKKADLKIIKQKTPAPNVSWDSQEIILHMRF
jgi:hypothetical protein